MKLYSKDDWNLEFENVQQCSVIFTPPTLRTVVRAGRSSPGECAVLLVHPTTSPAADNLT